jgi:hypothetical protein
VPGDLAAFALAATQVVVHVDTQVSNWEKIIAIFTAVGGLAAVAAASAAWRAAGKSAQAARDARDALAASLKPNVQLSFQQEPTGKRAVVVRVVVVGPLTPGDEPTGALSATDVTLEFHLASGRTDSVSMAVLAQVQRGPLWQAEPSLAVTVKEPTLEWPPAQGDHLTATVTYSDARRVAKYRLSRSVDLHRPDDAAAAEGGAVSFRNQTESDETRVSI